VLKTSPSSTCSKSSKSRRSRRRLHDDPRRRAPASHPLTRIVTGIVSRGGSIWRSG
jgi:hypothetical protein